MTAAIGFPLGTVYTITNITNGMPGVITLSSVAEPYSFAIEVGMTVTVSGVKGMNQVNDRRFVVSNLNADAMTFEMYNLRYLPVDTSGWIPYVSGGQINIISYPPPAGQPPGLMYNNQ